jgi:hypothetical protein
MRRAVAAAVLALSCTFSVPCASAVQITNVVPARAPTAGGTTITITGSGFSATDNSVMIGGRLCPVTLQSPNVVECTLPALTGENRPIQVIDNDTGQASPPFPFGALPPTITAITAASFPTAGGVPITIDGENFGALASEHHVLIGGPNSARTCSDPQVDQAFTRITCTLPPGEGIDVPVDVEVAGIETSAPDKVVYDLPVITDVTPSRVSPAGGVRLTIQGNNFGLASAVTVGGGSCTDVSQSHTRIECTSPPASGAPPDVRVTAGGQLSNAFPISDTMLLSKCDAAKFAAAASYAKCVFGAESKGDKKGAAADPAAVAKCDEKLAASCSKAEAKNDDCTQPATCGALQAKLHSTLKGVVGNIR